MATQKPISTISYNSESFLREKLETWYKAHIIQAYMYICHKGEDGDKDHIHLRIEPNKKLDAMDLEADLREYVVGEKKPRGVRPFRQSKEEDWFLYAVHDKEYLEIKYQGGEKGEKLPYEWQEIKAPDNYDVEVAFVRAKASLRHSSVSMAKRLQHGENPVDLLMQGENVYTLSAVMRAVSGMDYNRIAEENLRLKQENDLLADKLNALTVELDRIGIEVQFDEENVCTVLYRSAPFPPLS